MRRALAITLALAAFAAGSAHAQFRLGEQRIGTSSGTFLRIGVGARAVGLGESFVAVANDPSAIYWNPAGLASLQRREFAFSHVGLYLGDNRFIHAPSRGSEVEIARLSDSYWQKHFNGARRLVGVLPALVPTMITPAEAAPSAPLSDDGVASLDAADR